MLYAGWPLRRDGVDGTTSSDYYTDPGSNNFNPGVSSGGSYTTSSGEVITVYAYDLDEYNNAVITGYNGVGRALTIPSTIDGYTVVGIGENALKNRTGLGSVKIPKAGTTYYYRVRAVAEKSAANSAYSSSKYRMCDLPRPDVSIALKSGKPRLTWDAIDGAISYKIYRSTSKNGTYSLIKTTTSTSYTNTGAKSGTTYYYKVIAVHSKSAANSAYSLLDSVKSK